jgi:histidine phosphotransfer protein HptB
VSQKQSVEIIKQHLAEQFNLPMEQIDMLLPSFISTLGMHMGNLENAFAENNPVLLGKAGHTIKGAFLNLGLQDCAEIALNIEEKGRLGGSVAEFKQLIEDLWLLVGPVLEKAAVK